MSGAKARTFLKPAWLLAVLPAAILAAAAPRGDRHAAPPAPEGRLASDLPALATPYRTRVTRQTNVGLLVTNYGFFGNNLANKGPSFEFPLGTSQEHLVRAGVWVGALTSNGEVHVSTGTVAGSYGSLDPRQAS